MVNDLSGILASAGVPAAFLAVFAAFLFVAVILVIVFYVYMAIALMATAKRLKTEPAWLAWIPIANFVLLAKMAKMPTWFVWFALGYLIPPLIPFVNLFFMVMFVIWTFKICEARKKPGWWSILTIIPFFGGIWAMILWGILAWGK